VIHKPTLIRIHLQPILHPPKPLYKPTFQPVYPPETSITASNPQLYYLKDEEIDLATFLKNAHTTPSKATVGGESGVRWKSHWLAVEGVQPLIKENPITLLSEKFLGLWANISPLAEAYLFSRS
jgi:transcription initiation factor TFIID subunit 6